MHPILLLLLALFNSGTSSPGQTLKHQSEIQPTFSRLQNETTTEQAATQLRAMAKTDSSVKEYLSVNLPRVIEKQQAGAIWLNAVQLAGDLKIVSAVDELVVELGENDTVGGPITFAEEHRLDDDPPGKALAEIGDPAIAAVARALESDRKEVRWRAALVLMNINSPSAREILRRHLTNEPDPHVRASIQHGID
jgi:hypothetical protein